MKLPDPVKYVERALPLITKPEVEEYFGPLFLHGWSLAGMKLTEDTPKTPFLVAILAFKSLKASRKLLQRLLSLEGQENHHTSFNLLSTGKHPILTILIQTHSARHYDPEGTISPGITLRDIRLAVSLQKFAEEADLLVPQELSGELDKETWEALLDAYPWPSEDS
ncbi:unnamed protein product [Cyclocybe aegerita]|uniref:4a-hydroxytetrahydrobiopterin dehydratase n=1 Tax=Cyclocybe aegerita TaxID=1973307 RepID=A0A8S0W7W6_CYCAE|nr:unnamed protein product [Cyclocybe aegerita]